MKKILFFAVFVFAVAINANAQRFGTKAGLNNLSMSAGGDGLTGFLVGVTADFEMTESLTLQPEVLYSRFDGAAIFSVPVLAKYYVVDKFNLQAGPQMNFDFGAAPEEFNPFAVAVAAGGGYDISDQFFVDARYGFEVTDRYSGEAEDVSWKYNQFMVGLGYRF